MNAVAPVPQILPVEVANARFLNHLEASLEDLKEKVDVAFGLTLVLAARVTDWSHVSVSEAARMKGLSTRQIRRLYPVETIPGTRKTGVAIANLLGSAWTPLDLARVMAEREAAAASGGVQTSARRRARR